MFAEDFSPKAALAAASCPRCNHLGLVAATEEDCKNCKPENEFQLLMIICPSVSAICPTCGLLGDWPGMSWKPDEVHQEKSKRFKTTKL